MPLGIFAVFVIFGSLDFDTVFGKAPARSARRSNFLGWQVPSLTLACILLFVGAMGKSAQLGLHTWLPDAMEGPTPVSALIHAATMVTAGVFMVARLSPMFEYAPIALAVVGVIGGTTAMFAASVGMAQNDIKRVIAYSTCSQLGYMFFAAGVSAYGAAMFHLFTHAFFKALLFLGAGSVIHAMSRRAGHARAWAGSWSKIPITYALMWIGSLSLAGIPFFSGYFSKDTILAAAWASGTAVGRYSFCLGIFTAFLTAFYSWRLIIMTFHGPPRADQETLHHVHESPWVMLVAAVCAGGRRDRSPAISPIISLSARTAREFWKQRDPSAAAARFDRGRRARTRADRLSAADRRRDSASRSPTVCYLLRPGIPAGMAMRFRALYLFLLTNGTSTSSTTGSSCAAPSRSATGCGRPATARSSTGWARRHRRGDPRAGARGQPAADRLCLPLCLCHADRRRRAGHLVPVRRDERRERSEPMSHWPLLSLVTFLPLVGVGRSSCLRAATRRSSRATPAISRCRPR